MAYYNQGNGGYGQGGYGQSQGGYNQGGYNQSSGYGNNQSSGYGNNPYDRPANPYDRPSDPYDSGRNNYGNAPPAYGQASNVEMQPLNAQQPYSNSNTPAPQSDPNAILNECRTVSRSVDDLESRLGDLQRLQRGFVTGQGQSNKEIDSLSADIMTGYRGLTDRVRRIKGMRDASAPRNKSQVESLDRRLRNAIQSYQKVEASFRREVQESQRRQYLIVNPTATESEIQEATAGGGDTQIFQQALLNSDRRGQAQSTLRNVQQRHDAIQQIEKTMMELTQLFQDLDQMVVEQEDKVQDIEVKAEETQQHISSANVEVSKAIVSARAARRKKWICLGIVVAIIVVIVVAILIWLAVTGHFSSSSNNNGGNNNGGGSGH